MIWFVAVIFSPLLILWGTIVCFFRVRKEPYYTKVHHYFDPGFERIPQVGLQRKIYHWLWSGIRWVGGLVTESCWGKGMSVTRLRSEGLLLLVIKCGPLKCGSSVFSSLDLPASLFDCWEAEMEMERMGGSCVVSVHWFLNSASSSLQIKSFSFFSWPFESKIRRVLLPTDVPIP